MGRLAKDLLRTNKKIQELERRRAKAEASEKLCRRERKVMAAERRARKDRVLREEKRFKPEQAKRVPRQE